MISMNNALSMDELEQVNGGARGRHTSFVELEVDTSKYRNFQEALTDTLHHVIPCQGDPIVVQMTDHNNRMRNLLNSIFVCKDMPGYTHSPVYLFYAELDESNDIRSIQLK